MKHRIEPPAEPWRPLTIQERDLLSALLSEEFANAEALRVQIPFTEARAGCGCGCGCGCGSGSGSVDLRVDQTRAPSSAGGTCKVPAESDLPGEPPGGLMIFQRDGYLDHLEVYSFGDPMPLPTTDELAPMVLE